MKVSTERLENCQMAVTLEMDAADLDKALRQKARELSRQYTFPGYRKGKATYRAVVRAIGREALQTYWFEDAAEDLVSQAMEELDAEPYAPAELEDIEWDPFRIRFVIPLQPEVELGDYRSLRVEPEPVVVTDEQVDAQLHEYQEQQTQWVPVERPASETDQVVVNARAVVGEEPVWEEENLELLLADEDAEPVPGLFQHLVGTAPDETTSFTLVLPEDWDDADVAGAEAEFEITVQDVREKDVPPLDDDLAMTVGDYDSLEELTTSIRDALEEEARERIEAEFPGKVVDALVEQAERIEYPDQAVADQLEDMLEGLQQNLQGSGLGLDQYFQLLRTTEAQYREQLRPEADRRLRRSLALIEMARREKLSVDAEEIEAEVERVEETLPEEATAEREWLRSPEGRRAFANRLLTERVEERLLAIARGEAPDVEPEPAQEPESEAEPETEPTPEPDAESVAESLPEPAAKPEGSAGLDATPGDEPEPEPEA